MALHSVSLDLSGALNGPYLCPGCGSTTLRPVSDRSRVALLCGQCGSCWDPELSLMTAVDPAECTGYLPTGVHRGRGPASAS